MNTPPPQGVHILIVEDSPTQMERLKVILERNGHQVTAATDGMQALTLLAQFSPALVISDIVMPAMDGYELCRRIKADPHFNDTPVVLVTELTDPKDVLRGLECGADNFIIKPYDEKYLLARLQFVLLNQEICDDDRVSLGVEICIDNQRHLITADRLQILNLLLSTYDAAVQRNQELMQIQSDLRGAVASLGIANRELEEANERLKIESAEREASRRRLYTLNDELLKATRLAESANLAKNAFLANMSHEIRTPLSAILGFTDLLVEPRTSNEDRKAYMNTIRRNGEHLLRIINEVLDLSKIEAGKLVIERKACNPAQLLNEVISVLRVKAAERHIRLDARILGAVPPYIRSDTGRLRQILLNLVGNAIKFTLQGSVRVVLKVEQSDRMTPCLQFDVIDTGIGMAKEQIERLFQPFEQADSSTTRQFGGTGLGLSISKRLAEMLGGAIAVTSQTGHGSIFSLTIDAEPFIESEDGPGPQEDTPVNSITELRGHVLIVDDNADNRELFSVMLKQAGLDVSLADNGKIACETVLAAWKTGAPFDIVLMDMQMPELDGYHAASALRGEGYPGTIIALTAHAMADDRDKCILAGCTDFLSKPVRRDKLLNTLARYLRPATEAQAGTQDIPGEFTPVEPHPSRDASTRDLPLPVIRTALKDGKLRPMIDSYISQLPQRVQEIQNCLADGNLATLREKIHDLRGTGGLYGLMPITDAASAVEHDISGQASPDTIVASVNDLIDTISRVEGYTENSPAMSHQQA